MTYTVDKDLLKTLADDRNWRGITTSDLVYAILDLREDLDMLEDLPDIAIGYRMPADYTEKEWIEAHRDSWNCQLTSVIKELERRRHINEKAIQNPDTEIIQAIKSDMTVTDVLEWYTEVFYSNKAQFKFRCTLHGEDKNPSGVIYIDENRWWCFGCNRGGDAIDAVMAFEKCDFPNAIKKLATHLGIELRPLIEKPKLKIAHGVTL